MMYPNEPQPESPAETSYIAERSDIIRSSVTSTREHQAVINSSLRTGDRTMIKTDSGKGFGAADVRQELQTSSTANPKRDHRSLMQAGAGSWNANQTLVAHRAQHRSPRPPQFGEPNSAMQTPQTSKLKLQ